MRQSDYILDKTLNMFNDFKETLKTQKSREIYWNVLCQMCDVVLKDFSLYTQKDCKAIFNFYYNKAQNGQLMYSTVYNRLTIASSIAGFAEKHKELYGYPDSFVNHFFQMDKPEYNGLFKKEKALPLDDTDKLLETALKTDRMMYAVIALVSICGLTVSEICNLKKSNMVVDANNHLGIIFVRKPKNKYIRITDDVAKILENHLNAFPPTSDYIFTNTRCKPLTPRTLQLHFKKIIDMTFPDKNISLQNLRSTAAVRLIKAGASETAVAKYLGIGTRWINRYDKIIDEFNDSPVDLINFSVGKPTKPIEKIRKLDINAKENINNGEKKEK